MDALEKSKENGRMQRTCNESPVTAAAIRSGTEWEQPVVRMFCSTQLWDGSWNRQH